MIFKKMCLKFDFFCFFVKKKSKPKKTPNPPQIKKKGEKMTKKVLFFDLQGSTLGGSKITKNFEKKGGVKNIL